MKKLIFAVGLLFIACNPYTSVDSRTPELKEIEFKKADNNVTALPDKYSVLIIADSHFGQTDKAPEKKFFEFMDDLKAKNELPEFMISLGDTGHRGKQEQYDMYNEFCGRLEDEYGLICYNITGNHDLYGTDWSLWQKNCYPGTSFYHFVTKNFSWYFLDTGSGCLDYNQLEQLKAAMEEDDRPKIVSTHYPVSVIQFVWGMQNTTERNILLDLFARKNVKAVLGGHLPLVETHDFGTFKDYCLPSYRYSKGWSILYIDETQGTAYAESWYKNSYTGEEHY